MTKKEIIKQLEIDGTEFDSSQTKAELIKLLDQQDIKKEIPKGMDPTGIYAVTGGWKVEGIDKPFFDAGEAQAENYRIRNGG